MTLTRSTSHRPRKRLRRILVSYAHGTPNGQLIPKLHVAIEKQHQNWASLAGVKPYLHPWIRTTTPKTAFWHTEHLILAQQVKQTASTYIEGENREGHRMAVSTVDVCWYETEDGDTNGIYSAAI